MKCSRCGLEMESGTGFCGGCGAPRLVLPAEFQRVQENYERLYNRHAAGAISDEQFKAGVEAGVVNHQGTYWVIGAGSGRWYRSDGQNWIDAQAPLDQASKKAPS